MCRPCVRALLDQLLFRVLNVFTAKRSLHLKALHSLIFSFLLCSINQNVQDASLGFKKKSYTCSHFVDFLMLLMVWWPEAKIPQFDCNCSSKEYYFWNVKQHKQVLKYSEEALSEGQFIKQGRNYRIILTFSKLQYIVTPVIDLWLVERWLS